MYRAPGYSVVQVSSVKDLSAAAWPPPASRDLNKWWKEDVEIDKMMCTTDGVNDCAELGSMDDISTRYIATQN